MMLILQDAEAAESSDVNAAAASTNVTVDVPSEETRVEASTGCHCRTIST